jgi:hypothetical protein
VKQIGAHEIIPSLKSFSNYPNVSPRTIVEAGGHDDGVDQPAGRPGTQMMLLFDDLYTVEVYSGADVSTSCLRQIKINEKYRILLK